MSFTFLESVRVVLIVHMVTILMMLENLANLGSLKKGILKQGL